MEQKSIAAKPRTELKKGASRRARRNGNIPAIIYGHSGNAPVLVDAHDFWKLFKNVSENSIIKLEMDDSSKEVLVKDYQEDIITGKILHIDFYEIEQGVELRTHVPVHLEGTPPGVKEGGVMEQLLYSIDVECLPKDIPEQFVLDASALQIGESLHVSDIEAPEGVRFLTADDQVVVSITTMKMEIEEEVEEEELEEGEEPEEGEETEESEEDEE